MVIKLPRKYINKPRLDEKRVEVKDEKEKRTQLEKKPKKAILNIMRPIIKQTLNRVNNLFSKAFDLITKMKRPSRAKAVLLGVGIVFILLLLNIFRLVFFAKTPIIYLEKPISGEIVRSEMLYVAGRVEPISAHVTVNGEKPAVNGDGTFTAVVEISRGESILEVTASHWFKKARVLVIVNRKLSAEEILLKEEQSRAQQGLSEIEKQAHVRVTSNSLIVDGRNAKIIGEVTNFSENDVTDIEITVTFLNIDSTVVDRKYGIAYGFNEALAPGEVAQFETTRTASDFLVYQLSLAWNE